MPKMTHTLHKMKVAGFYPFPVDMLRYDNAWPVSSEDASKIARLIDTNDRLRGRQEVELYFASAHALSGPTAGRWQSFCWDVVEVDGHAVKSTPL